MVGKADKMPSPSDVTRELAAFRSDGKILFTRVGSLSEMNGAAVATNSPIPSITV